MVHLLHFLLTVYLPISMTSGCGTVNQRTPLERMQALVQRAEEHRDGNLIVLPSFQSPALESGRVINRAPVRTIANFSCTVEGPSRDHMDGAARPAILWRHLDKSIYSNTSAPDTSEPFSYSQSVTGNIHYLFIHNVSVTAAGHVDCLQSCNSTHPETMCVRKQYDLRPKLRPEDLFVSPMQNKSLQFPWESDFTCHLRHTPCALGGTAPYFIWKVNEVFDVVPRDHYLFPLIRSQGRPQGVVQTEVSSQYYKPDNSKTLEQGSCATSLNIKIYNPTDYSPVRVQCWVRPNPSTEEWYVQIAYATIH